MAEHGGHDIGTDLKPAPEGFGEGGLARARRDRQALQNRSPPFFNGVGAAGGVVEDQEHVAILILGIGVLGHPCFERLPNPAGRGERGNGIGLDAHSEFHGIRHRLEHSASNRIFRVFGDRDVRLGPDEGDGPSSQLVREAAGKESKAGARNAHLRSRQRLTVRGKASACSAAHRGPSASGASRLTAHFRNHSPGASVIT